MSWTGYWLLRWLELVNDSRIVPYTTRYGDFLLRQQRSNGVIASWIHSTSGRTAYPFALVNAETAGSALFLAKLYQVSGNAAHHGRIRPCANV